MLIAHGTEVIENERKNNNRCTSRFMAMLCVWIAISYFSENHKFTLVRGVALHFLNCSSYYGVHHNYHSGLPQMRNGSIPKICSEYTTFPTTSSVLPSPWYIHKIFPNKMAPHLNFGNDNNQCKFGIWSFS